MVNIDLRPNTYGTFLKIVLPSSSSDQWWLAIWRHRRDTVNHLYAREEHDFAWNGVLRDGLCGGIWLTLLLRLPGRVTNSILSSFLQSRIFLESVWSVKTVSAPVSL